MKEARIRLSSVTYAMRAQKVLEQHGIRSHIRKITQDMQAKGCGYALDVSGDLNEAVQILKAAGIRMGES